MPSAVINLAPSPRQCTVEPPRLQNDQLIVEGTPETVTVPSAVITCAPRVRSSVRRSDAAEKTRDDTSCSFEFTVEILRNA